MSWTVQTGLLNDSGKKQLNAAAELFKSLEERENVLERISNVEFYYSNALDSKVSPSVADMSGLHIEKMGLNISILRNAIQSLLAGKNRFVHSSYNNYGDGVDDLLTAAGHPGGWDTDKTFTNRNIWDQFQDVFDELQHYKFIPDLSFDEQWLKDGDKIFFSSEAAWDNAVAKMEVTQGASADEWPGWFLHKTRFDSSPYYEVFLRRKTSINVDLTNQFGTIGQTIVYYFNISNSITTPVDFIDAFGNSWTVSAPEAAEVISKTSNSSGNLVAEGIGSHDWEVTTPPPETLPLPEPVEQIGVKHVKSEIRTHFGIPDNERINVFLDTISGDWTYG